MSSSKFATPFFQKSPLRGAYTSGADAIVTISDAPHFAKMQSDIAETFSKASAHKKNKCAKGAEYYFDSGGAKFPCDKKEDSKATVANSEVVQAQTEKAQSSASPSMGAVAKSGGYS